jgi:hypothetical protein
MQGPSGLQSYQNKIFVNDQTNFTKPNHSGQSNNEAKEKPRLCATIKPMREIMG